jgi:hypothetical protein
MERKAFKDTEDSFNIYDLVIQNYYDQYCGTADGDAEIFDIPGISTSSQKVYKNRVEQTLTVDYSILPGNPDWPDSCDRINFCVAPSAGEVITVDFTGILRIRARFFEDKLQKELFKTKLYRCEIRLKGLANQITLPE